MHAFGLNSDGKWKVIRNDTENYRKGYVPSFRAFFVPLVHKDNHAYYSKFIYTEAGDGDDDHNLQSADQFPAEVFDSDLSEAYDDNTGMEPVIHTIDRDGTHRYYDLQGHKLPGKPVKKSLYIKNGKKVIIK